MPAKRVRDLPAVEIPAPYHRLLRTMFSTEQDPGLIGDFTMFHVQFFPHCTSDNHTHKKEGEVLYVISGKGEASLGDEVFPLEPETVFFAPPGVPHQVRNLGDEMLVMITLFHPGVGTAYARGKATEKHEATPKG